VQSEIRNWDLLDQLSQLRRCSLLTAEEVAVPAGVGGSSAEMRFRMLDTVREYAEERLAPEGREALQRRHRDWFLVLAEQSEPQLFGPERSVYLQRLEREHDNLRAAVAWSFERREFAEGLRLATALWPFLLTYGYRNEAQEWLRAGGEGAKLLPAAIRARWLLVQGHLARDDAECDRARACYAESRALYEGMGDEFGVTRTLMGMAALAAEEEDNARAHQLFAECAECYRRLGRRPAVALCLDSRGGIAYYEGDLATARRFWEQTLALWQELNSPHGIAAMFNNLGLLAAEQEDFAQARSLFERCLATGRELQEPRHVAIALGNLAGLCADEGRHEEARALCEESVEIWRRIGERRGLVEALCYLGRSVDALGDSEQARAYLEESFLLCNELLDRRGLACALEEFARLYAASEPERAAQLFGAAAAFRDAIGAPQLPRERSSHAGWLDDVRRRLGPAVFQAALAQGRTMSAQQAIARARLTAGQEACGCAW
jgi:non-specific serine/threonine protein kinase